jgi:hypothetical protein
MNVKRDVAPMEVSDLDPKITLQNFHRHGGLLLSDAGEGVEPPLKLIRGWLVGPNCFCVAAVFLNNPATSERNPPRHIFNVAMQLRDHVHRGVNSLLVEGDAFWLKMAQSLL